MIRPRILHVIHSSAFGGGPNMLAILCAKLGDQFEMEVASDGQGDVPARLEAMGVAFHTMPLTSKWSFLAQMPRLAALIRSRTPDLVQLHGQFAGSLGQISVQLAGRPRSLYTVQWPSYLDDTGPWSRLRNHVAERVSCGFSTAVVAVSENDRRTLVERGLCSADKITVIHNAYRSEGTEEGPGSAPAGANGGVIGFVGRLTDQKGCEYLVRAVPQVLARFPRTKFVIVGDGPERGRLERLADELQVTAAVDFAGYQASPISHIQAMDVVAIPSIYDPFPLVTLEVMALGRPVVGSAVGGIPEAVEDGRTGLLVPPREPAALAAALVQLLDAPELRRVMGEAGRARARRLFSPEVIAGEYAALYRRLLATTSS
jgi:glycosyltransferase involved in cell wall biosynthesis